MTLRRRISGSNYNNKVTHSLGTDIFFYSNMIWAILLAYVTISSWPKGVEGSLVVVLYHTEQPWYASVHSCGRAKSFLQFTQILSGSFAIINFFFFFLFSIAYKLFVLIRCTPISQATPSQSRRFCKVSETTALPLVEIWENNRVYSCPKNIVDADAM